MTATFRANGNILKVVAPTGGTTRGTAVVVGELFGMPSATVLVSEDVNIEVAGVFEVTKVSAQAWAIGQDVYWDNANSKFTTVRTDRKAGVATAVAANPTSTGKMLLMAPGAARGFTFGTSTTPIVDDVADKKFMSGYLDDGSASGDNRMMYLKYIFTGAGGGGDGFRMYTVIDGVAKGTVHSAHISLAPSGIGTVTGQGAAMRNTLHVPNVAMGAGGTYSPNICEIWSDGDDSDPAAVTLLAFMRFVNGGNANGVADVDDKAYLFTVEGGAIASGNVIAAKSSAAVSHTARVRIHNTVKYVMLSDNQ